MPTLTAELPARFNKDERGESLTLVLELPEMEACDRQQRRADRLARASDYTLAIDPCRTTR